MAISCNIVPHVNMPPLSKSKISDFGVVPRVVLWLGPLIFFVLFLCVRGLQEIFLFSSGKISSVATNHGVQSPYPS